MTLAGVFLSLLFVVVCIAIFAALPVGYALPICIVLAVLLVAMHDRLARHVGRVLRHFLFSQVTLGIVALSARRDLFVGSDDVLAGRDIIMPSESPAKEIQAELGKLEPGRIRFNPKSRMTVGTGETVEVRIATSAAADLEVGLAGGGEPKTEPIKVGDVMAAKLRGAGFDIKALSSGTQVVPQGNAADAYAQWTWRVTPTAGGSQQLILLVSVVIKVRGVDDTVRDLPVFRRTVEVDVDRVRAVKAFVAGNWQFLLTTLAIPLVLWLVKDFGWLDWATEIIAPGGQTTGSSPA